MASHASHSSSTSARLDLSRFAKIPMILMIVGGMGAAAGAAVNLRQFGYSWLLAFMFFLSLMAGGLFLTLVHHLFDASWSVPVRRVNEHLACLAPVLAVLFIPIALLAPRLFPWMNVDPHTDHAIQSKLPLFTMPAFYLVAAFCFGVWVILGWSLRSASLAQDKSGAVALTYRMRLLSAVGIFLFAISLTLGAIMWMKALMHQWFSTMYGVWYFAGSVWTTLATVWVIIAVLKRTGHLELLQDKHFYFLGTLFFAFTVFYAYVTFSQYFIIWNANMPEETFWYKVREKGTWYDLSMVIIFGHFFLPFLSLLRIDAKMNLAVMAPLAAWAWIMHFCDLSYNIMPVLHPDGFVLHWIDLSCWAFMAGLVATVWLRAFKAHPAFPQNDPRMAESLGVHLPSPAPAGKRAAAH